MSITKADLRTAAKVIAQDAGPGSTATGVQLLLADPGDYNVAVDQALAIFQKDRPNQKVFDFTVVTAGFLFVLDGAGEIVADWIDGLSYFERIWWPFNAADQGSEPLDENTWRLRRTPVGPCLEFLGFTAAVGNIIRLEYVTSHTIHESVAASTTLKAGDVEAMKVLAASLILQLTANKWLQNTGNTGLPNDVVDRRTQSDVAKSRAKELRDLYNAIVGKGEARDLTAASGFKDLDIEPVSGRYGYQWHPSWRR